MAYNNNASRFSTIEQARAAYIVSASWKRTKAGCPKFLLELGEPPDAYLRGAFEQWLFRKVDADEMAEIEKHLRELEPKMREVAKTAADPWEREIARDWLGLNFR